MLQDVIRGWIHARALLAAAAVATFPARAIAYRPFDGTDAAVAARGEVELELAPLGFVHAGPARSLAAPGAILNWGFAERWELVLEGRHLVQLGEHVREPRFRVDDTAVALKHVVHEGALQERSGASVAAELSALLPTFHAGSGAGAALALVASQRWPDLTVHLNAAAAWTRAHRLGLFGGAIVELHDAWTVRPVAEVFVEGERDEPTVVSGLAGAIWRVGDALSFDAGARVARAGGVATTELRAGLTWGFHAGSAR